METWKSAHLEVTSTLILILFAKFIYGPVKCPRVCLVINLRTVGNDTPSYD